MALAATDAEDRVEQLIILTERLTALIAEQALAFEQRRPRDAAALNEETSRLANLYKAEGRLKEAVAVLRNGVRIFPTNSALYRLYGEMRGVN